MKGKVDIKHKIYSHVKNSYNLSDLVFLRSEAVTKLQNLPNYYQHNSHGMANMVKYKL